MARHRGRAGLMDDIDSIARRKGWTRGGTAPREAARSRKTTGRDRGRTGPNFGRPSAARLSRQTRLSHESVTWQRSVTDTCPLTTELPQSVTQDPSRGICHSEIRPTAPAATAQTNGADRRCRRSDSRRQRRLATSAGTARLCGWLPTGIAADASPEATFTRDGARSEADRRDRRDGPVSRPRHTPRRRD